MSLSFSPIGPWPLVALAAFGVVGVTIWAYRARLRETQGGWRWVALTLRMLSVLLCLIAAVRPSVVMLRKVKQTASLVFMIDSSESMTVNDEAGHRMRWDVAKKALDESVGSLKKRLPDLDVKVFRFDTSLREDSPGEPSPPKGKGSEIGGALDEMLRRFQGARVATAVLLSDGRSNGGPSPLDVAQRLRRHQIPVVTVGFGSEGGGASARDLSARDLVTASTVYVKNELKVRAVVGVRGFPNEDIDVELYLEGRDDPVATRRVRAKEGEDVLTIDDLSFTPTVPGEKRLTFKVKNKEGELIASNNKIDTYVNVLKGGINVLFLQGPSSPWEKKYLMRALDAAREIQANLRVLTRPARGDEGDLDTRELAAGAYDVYILSDVAADYLTKSQQRLLARAVERGAGLIMLGGRSSYGSGGWGGTSLDDVMPFAMNQNDGQIEPEEGLKVVPNTAAIDSFVLQLGPTRTENLRLWNDLPPISGANDFGKLKPGAVVLTETLDGRPLMISQEPGQGRVLAFAGETWVWARATAETQAAHRRFWRQAILWLAHKENDSTGQVRIELDRRRISQGQKLDLKVAARDAKDEPIADAKFEVQIEYLGPKAKPEHVDVFNQGVESRGAYYALGEAGEYRATVHAKSAKGQDLGVDVARFQVYQDDRELENPSADKSLLEQISSITGGKFLAPEALDKHLQSLGDGLYTEYVRHTEYRAWDNWPFFLLFVLLLSAEWWLRKRKGLV